MTKPSPTAQLSAIDGMLEAAGIGQAEGGEVGDRVKWLLDSRDALKADLERARDREFEQADAIDKADELAAREQAVNGQLATPLIDNIMAVIRNLAKPWNKLNEFQQNDLIASISSRVRASMMHGLRVMAAGDHPTLSAKLVDFSAKGSTIKVKLEALKTIENLTMLGRIGEGQIDVVFTDIRIIDDGSRPVETKADPDQPDLVDQLPLEEPEPRPTAPLDDSDLAGDDPDPDPDAIDPPAGDDVDQTQGEDR